MSDMTDDITDTCNEEGGVDGTDGAGLVCRGRSRASDLAGTVAEAAVREGLGSATPRAQEPRGGPGEGGDAREPEHRAARRGPGLLGQGVADQRLFRPQAG